MEQSPERRIRVKRWRRWAVDIDYSHRLPSAAREWLEKFNREFYDADFRGVEPLHASNELRRSCYSAQNAAYRDVMSRGAVRLEGSEWLERQANSNVRPESLAWESSGQQSFPF